LRKSQRACLILMASALASIAVSRADGRVPPPGCHWQDLPEIKVHLAVPDGWLFRQVQSEGTLIYEVVPAGNDWPTPSKSRYRLEVRLHTERATVVTRARDFVDRARSGATAAQPLAEQTIGVMKAFSTFAEYSPAVQGAPRIATAVSALANTRTGTLYTTRFDIAADEQEKIATLGNSLFQTARVDDEI
jgi:hypothetical protein